MWSRQVVFPPVAIPNLVPSVWRIVRLGLTHMTHERSDYLRTRMTAERECDRRGDYIFDPHTGTQVLCSRKMVGIAIIDTTRPLLWPGGTSRQVIREHVRGSQSQLSHAPPVEREQSHGLIESTSVENARGFRTYHYAMPRVGDWPCTVTTPTRCCGTNCLDPTVAQCSWRI